MKSWIPTTERAGIGLALVTAVISGFAIYLNGFLVRQAPGALSFTTAKNLVAAALVGAVLTGVAARGSLRPAFQDLGPRQLLALGYVGFISGGLAFALFFQGLAQSSPVQAAFIHKSLIIWVALLAVPLLQERIGWGQWLAIGTLVAGQVLLLMGAGAGAAGSAAGLVMVFAATLLWAGEVVLLRRLLQAVPVPVVGTVRMGVGALVLMGWLAVSGGIGQLGALGEIWVGVLLTGVILAGFVLSWLGALRRAPAVEVTAVLVLGAFVTALLSLPSADLVPPTRIAGMALILAGVVLILWIRLRSSGVPQPAPETSPAGTRDANGGRRG